MAKKSAKRSKFKKTQSKNITEPGLGKVNRLKNGFDMSGQLAPLDQSRVAVFRGRANLGS